MNALKDRAALRGSENGCFMKVLTRRFMNSIFNFHGNIKMYNLRYLYIFIYLHQNGT